MASTSCGGLGLEAGKAPWASDEPSTRPPLIGPPASAALKMEWTGFALHIDDKLRPKADAKPRQMAGLVEVRLEGESVDFLVPA